MSIDLSRPSSGIGDCDSLLGDNSDTTTPSRTGGSRYLLQRSSLGTGSVDMEDAQSQMDLALNANFDIGGLFDYNWSVDEPNSINPTTTAPLHVNNGNSGNGGLEETKTQLASLSSPYDNRTNGMLHPRAISSSAECPPNGPSARTAPLISLGNGESSQHALANFSSQGEVGPGTELDTTTSDRNPSSDWNASVSPALSSLPANVLGSNPMTTGAFFLPNQPGTMSLPLTSTEVTPPPFLLFDAPIELRANFIASQQAQGFPALDDNNSFHYQRQAQQRNVVAPRLVDGRHGSIGSKRVKNEREQKRTQKITDLIDQLRDKMEEGGWKVGGTKSKYATLSTCAEFVKHLVQSNKEQELAVEKTRQDLEAKRRKIEDDKEYQQDPSEPESTTSSLTISSASSTLNPPATIHSTTGNSNDQNNYSSSRNDCPQNRKAKVSARGSNNDDLHQLNRISSSNKGSSSEGTSSEGQNNRLVSIGREEASNSSSSGVTTSGDVSSVGAVARGLCNRTQIINHADVIVKSRKPRPAASTEVTSMDDSFLLDYEEVFIKSNVPQLLATTAGRIVAWNDIFLKAAGLLASDMDGLTIFSLVRQTELAKLFEIVAAALRSGSMDDVEGQFDHDHIECEALNPLKGSDKVMSSHFTEYTAITLPCAPFRPRMTNGSKGGKVVLESLLYMTVTLMKDKDPKKRCFHCLFTDCNMSSGTLGSVSPDLLATFFTRRTS